MAVGVFLAGLIMFVALTCYLASGAEMVPVLMYHELVDSSEKESRYSLSVEKFRDHLKYLKSAGYSPITDGDLLFARNGGSSLPFKPVIITFDDGSSDHATLAMNSLAEQGFRAVFFIITERIGQPNFLNRDQLRTMHNAGMSIQSHGHTHRRLDRMASDKLADDLRLSMEALTNLLATNAVSLCVPGGWYNEDVLNSARTTGYRLVFTSDIGMNRIYGSNPILKRLEIRGGTDSGGFKRALSPMGIAFNALIRQIKLVGHMLRGNS